MSDRKITDTELDGLIAECFSPLIGELTDSRLGFALVELRDLRAENERLPAVNGRALGHLSHELFNSTSEATRDALRGVIQIIRSAHETGEAREEGE